MVQIPWHATGHKLTGNLRVRIGRFGRIILQVEEQFRMERGWGGRPEIGSTNLVWRDATMIDIQTISPMRLAKGDA